LIVGKLSEWQADREAYSEWLSDWLTMLNESDFDAASDGETPLTDAARLIVKTADTLPPHTVFAEHHWEHADIHYVIEGEEWFGVARRCPKNKPERDHPPVEDHVFFKEVDNEQFVRLQPGEFIVMFPNDVHRPCCTLTGDRGSVRKAILKIRVPNMKK